MAFEEEAATFAVDVVVEEAAEKTKKVVVEPEKDAAETEKAAVAEVLLTEKEA